MFWGSLQSHQPLDLVILFLGTNDCKSIFHASPRVIAAGMEKPYFQEVADRNGCLFLDAAKVAAVSRLDQLHLDEDGHRAVAESLFQLISDYFHQKA